MKKFLITLSKLTFAVFAAIVILFSNFVSFLPQSFQDNKIAENFKVNEAEAYTPNSMMVYHRSLSNVNNLVLNTTAAEVANATAWNSTTADASVFSLGTHADVNTSGGTYIAYVFAHDTSLLYFGARTAALQFFNGKLDQLGN